MIASLKTASLIIPQKCGVLLQGGHRINFVNCSFTNTKDEDGVAIGGTVGDDDVAFTNCQAYNNNFSGFKVGQNDIRISFSNCRSFQNKRIGFSIGYGDYVTLYNCHAYYNQRHGIQFTNNADDGVIVGGVVHDNSESGAGIYQGIYIESSLRTRIEGVRIFGANQDAGVRINDGNDVSVVGCTIGANRTAGIWIQDGDDDQFCSNRFITEQTPLNGNRAACVRPMVIGNSWKGCTNNANFAGAIAPRITSNIDTAGAWCPTT